MVALPIDARPRLIQRITVGTCPMGKATRQAARPDVRRSVSERFRDVIHRRRVIGPYLTCGCRILVWSADLRLCPSLGHRVIDLQNCAIHPNRRSITRSVRGPSV